MRRPPNITIIGVLVLMQGVVFSLYGSGTLAVFGATLLSTLPPEIVVELPPLALRDLLLAAAALVMGTVTLVSGIGILRLRPWAWLMAMIAQGINLAAELVNYSRGHAIYLNMVVSVVIVLYLNQRDVQRSFSVAQHRADPVSTRTAQADQEAAAEVQHL